MHDISLCMAHYFQCSLRIFVFYCPIIFIVISDIFGFVYIIWICLYYPCLVFLFLTISRILLLLSSLLLKFQFFFPFHFMPLLVSSILVSRLYFFYTNNQPRLFSIQFSSVQSLSLAQLFATP